MYSYAPFLDRRFTHELLAWKTALYGISALPPRSKKCYFATKSSLNMLVSRLFVEAHLGEAARNAALQVCVCVCVCVCV